MTRYDKDTELSNIVIKCGSLASILEDCLGPNGRAVLMEQAGNVVITQDGTELVTTLEICDPILHMVVRGIVDQTKFFGDGCKVSFLLLRRLLSSLDKHVSANTTASHNVRRQKMVQITHHLRTQVLGDIQKDVIKYGAQVYPLHSFEVLGNIFHSTSEYFFQTKFSKLVAKKLAQLQATYLSCQSSSSGELINLLNDLANGTHFAIVEVYSTPLLKSQVVSGYVITRNFKYLHQCTKLENISMVLWSIQLEDEKDDDVCKAILETDNNQMLVDSICFKFSLIDSHLAFLKSLGVKVIFSSTYFPDWAVSQCSRYGISLVDMIDSDEWNFLIKKLKITPITSGTDIHRRSVYTLERIEPIILGTSHFIRLHGLDIHQIILCGPTSTQCKQFSNAYRKLFRYLNSWVFDCVECSQNNQNIKSEETGNLNTTAREDSPFATISSMPYANTVPEEHCRHNYNVHACINADAAMKPQYPKCVLYSVPHNGYVELLAKYLVMENISVNIDDASVKLIFMDVFNEIPWLLHKKTKVSPRCYTEVQTRLYDHFRKFRSKNHAFPYTQIMEDYKFLGYQNPFMIFKVIDSVLKFAEFILRIECIVPAKNKMSNVVRSEVGTC